MFCYKARHFTVIIWHLGISLIKSIQQSSDDKGNDILLFLTRGQSKPSSFSPLSQVDAKYNVKLFVRKRLGYLGIRSEGASTVTFN